MNREHYRNGDSVSMFSLRKENLNLKFSARLVSLKYVFLDSLYLSKEVMWVSIVQTAVKLQVIKVGALKKNSSP